MNVSKAIDISKSSLVGLKAELLKKQEEVKRLKELQQDHVKPVIIVHKKKSGQQKSNEGVEKRCLKDKKVIEEDYDVLQKSREILEAKSRLYDKLKGNIVDEETKSKYLIDFDLKREIEEEKTSAVEDKESCEHSEEEDNYSDYNSDPENDWVDFVDSLGRSRRCLRKDLPEMKSKDATLAASLRPPSPPPEPTPAPELLSWDMQREIMRKKWEEQETVLLGKKDIHYQDIRFDEARPHGVGYFEFSTDEAERVRQQQELQKLRTQTKEQQEAAQGLRVRREQQLQARLAAARQRRRERLGLPPESPPRETETPKTINEEEQNKDVKEEKVNDLEESIKKIAPVRPWDIGKNSVAPVMSQEEWIEKKRLERPEEFAPPSSLLESTSLEIGVEQKWQSNPNVFTSKKVRRKQFSNKKHKANRCSSEEFNDREEIIKEEDETEICGPSVKDWEQIVQQKEVVSVNMSNFQRNLSTPECQTQSLLSENVSDAEIRIKDILRPTVKQWKPSIRDIDVLLSKSRAEIFNTSEEVGSKSQSPNEDSITILTEIQEKQSNDTSISAEEYQDKDVSDLCFVGKRQHSNIRNFTSKDGKKQKSRSANDDTEAIVNTVSSETVINPIVNLLEVDSDDDTETSTNKSVKTNQWKSNKRKYAEIPPPPSMSYYIDTDNGSDKKLGSSSKPQLADSISAGLNYMKSRAEEKNKKRLKGLLDIM